MILLALFGLIVGRGLRYPVLGVPVRSWGYILLLYALGPGLLVDGLLKRFWGRARPADVQTFGGDTGLHTAAPDHRPVPAQLLLHRRRNGGGGRTVAVAAGHPAASPPVDDPAGLSVGAGRGGVPGRSWPVGSALRRDGISCRTWYFRRCSWHWCAVGLVGAARPPPRLAAPLWRLLTTPATPPIRPQLELRPLVFHGVLRRGIRSFEWS